MHFKISYYYLATGMEGKADIIPETHVEADSQDLAIFNFWKAHGYYANLKFDSFMRLSKTEREWGLTIKPWRSYKKRVGRPSQGPKKVQFLRRAPFQHVDNIKLIVDYMLVEPELIALLLDTAKGYIRQKQLAHSPHSTAPLSH